MSYTTSSVEKCIQNIGWNILKQRTHSEYLSRAGVKIKMDEKEISGCGLDSFSSGQTPVTGFCAHGN